MTSMTIRVDEQLKKSFDILCDEFGISNSAALNMFMKTVVRERRIPFVIRADSEADIRRQGWDAFMRMRDSIQASDATEMSLEDINAEISAVRNAK